MVFKSGPASTKPLGSRATQSGSHSVLGAAPIKAKTVLAGPDLKTKAGNLWKYERDPYLLETTVPGIFVAGDVRFGSVKRVASSVGEGSIAIQFVHQYLATL